MNTNTTAGNLNDMDSLLDATLDDLEDLPEFKPYPAGAHRVTIAWDYSKFGTDKTIDLKVVGIETVEMGSNPEGTEPIKTGDTTQQRFFLTKTDKNNPTGPKIKNEFGEGQWKSLLAPLQAHFGTGSIRETMDASQGAEVLMVTKVKANKQDPHDIKYNTEFVSLAVV